MKVCNVLFLSLAVCVATPGLSSASSIYDGSAGFTVNMPPAITNTFGYARFPVIASGASLAIGNALASYGRGAETVTIPGGGVTVVVSGMTIAGRADPDGHASSNSKATVAFNLGNFTGSEGGTPPAQVLDVFVSGSYTYALSALAGPCSECHEFAFAKFSWDVTFGGAKIDSFSDSVNDDFFDPTNLFGYTLSLAPNSVTRLEFTATLDGIADAESVPKAPLPAGAPLMISALIGVWAARRLHRP